MKTSGTATAEDADLPAHVPVAHPLPLWQGDVAGDHREAADAQVLFDGGKVVVKQPVQGHGRELEFLPITNVDRVMLEDLLGYERQKEEDLPVPASP